MMYYYILYYFIYYLAYLTKTTISTLELTEFPAPLFFPAAMSIFNTHTISLGLNQHNTGWQHIV